MNTVQKIAKNSLVLLASNIISKILGFFYVMYIARYLGAEGFGILSFALAFTGIFGVFSDLGLSTLTVREVARDKSLAGKYLGNITVIKIFLVIITFGLIAITIKLLGYPTQTIKVVYFLALSVIFSSFSNIFNSIFQAYEKMEYQSIEQILSSTLMLVGALFAISQGFSVVGFASIYFMVSAISLGYSFVVCVWKFTKPKIEVDWNFWKPTIKEALPFGLIGIFVTIYFWIDSVMLSLMKGNEVVGWYSMAYRLIVIIGSINASFFSAIFPATSKYYKTSRESLIIAYKKSFKYLSIVGLPIAMGTTLLANRIIMLIYGSEYGPSITALRILIWAGMFLFLTPLFGTILASIDRQDLGLRTTGVCALANVLMNLLLIPKFSYIGASVATVVTEAIGFILQYYFISKHLYQIQLHKYIAIPLVATLAMSYVIFELKQLNLFVLVLIAITVYLTILHELRAFPKEDVDLLTNILKSLRKEKQR